MRIYRSFNVQFSSYRILRKYPEIDFRFLKDLPKYFDKDSVEYKRLEELSKNQEEWEEYIDIMLTYGKVVDYDLVRGEWFVDTIRKIMSTNDMSGGSQSITPSVIDTEYRTDYSLKTKFRTKWNEVMRRKVVKKDDSFENV